MSRIPYSKTSPRKKRRESAAAAVQACLRAGEPDLFQCALKRNGPWNRRIYSKAESRWVQAAFRAAAKAYANRHASAKAYANRANRM